MEDGAKIDHDNLINLIKSLHDKVDQLQNGTVKEITIETDKTQVEDGKIEYRKRSKIDGGKNVRTFKKIANITRVCLSQQSASLTETLSNAIIKKNLEDTLQCYQEQFVLSCY